MCTKPGTQHEADGEETGWGQHRDNAHQQGGQYAKRAILVCTPKTSVLDHQGGEQSGHDKEGWHSEAVDESKHQIKQESMVSVRGNGHSRRDLNQVEGCTVQDDSKHHHATTQGIQSIVSAVFHGDP